MSVDSKSILDALESPKDREKTSLYLSQALLKDFKAAAKGKAVSKVVEQLMRAFVADAKRKAHK